MKPIGKVRFISLSSGWSTHYPQYSISATDVDLNAPTRLIMHIGGYIKILSHIKTTLKAHKGCKVKHLKIWKYQN